MGWPFDTMKRFELFLTQEDKLKEYDYIYFFNANTKFIAAVGDEIFPSLETSCGIMTGSHPDLYNKKPDEYSYDRNPKSTAYIPYGQGTHYATGALNGGIASEYLKMCKELSNNVNIDLNNDVIALWHDESHLNKYLVDKIPHILDVRYLYHEENWIKKDSKNTDEFKNDVKILSTDKTAPRYGGHDYLRGQTNKKKRKHTLQKLIDILRGKKRKKNS